MLNAAAYQQLMLQPGAGEEFRWWRATPTDQNAPGEAVWNDRADTDSDHGQVYRDGGTMRGLVWQQRKTVEHPDFGILVPGTLMLTTLREQVAFGRFDKVTLLQRVSPAVDVLKVGSDTLHHGSVTRILRVATNAQDYVEGTDWKYDLTAGAIMWQGAGSAPATGAIYVCQYEYRPTYVFWGEQERQPRPILGGSTPQTGVLSLKPPVA